MVLKTLSVTSLVRLNLVWIRHDGALELSTQERSADLMSPPVAEASGLRNMPSLHNQS